MSCTARDPLAFLKGIADIESMSQAIQDTLSSSHLTAVRPKGHSCIGYDALGAVTGISIFAT